MEKKFYPQLESLRGIAALWVIILHIDWLFPLGNSNFIRNGYLMVDFFFILSGFVISHNYNKRIKTFKDAWHFMVLRFFRLYPLHIATLLFFVIAFGAIYIYKGEGLEAYFDKFSFSFVANIFMIHALGVVPDYLLFNAPSWSISVEFYAYLVFAMISIVFASRWVINLIIAIAAFALLFLYAEHLNQAVNQFGFLRCLLGFNIGCLLYRLPFSKLKANFLIFPSLIIFTSFFVLKTPNVKFDLFVYIPCSLLMITAIGSSNKTFNNILSSKALVKLGMYSYSIYMIHETVMYTIKLGLAFKNVPLVNRGTALVFDPGTIIGIFLILFYLFVTFALAYLSYKYIEEPYRLIGRDLVRKWQNKSVSITGKQITEFNPSIVKSEDL